MELILSAAQFRRLGLTLLLVVLTTVLIRSASAQPVAGSRDMERYMADAGCAAAAQAWLIGMPNGTAEKDQNDAWSVAAFYARNAQASGRAAGYSPDRIVGATQAFVADLLPKLKSSDPAVADKARAEAAAGTRSCASRPEFKAATPSTNQAPSSEK